MKFKKNPPLVSVILPVYNAEKYLEESINSVLGQTIKDFELIIIDDGSKDESRDIIKKLQKKDKRIRAIYNVKNLRLQKTLNKGLRVAKGKYIARMDADDICFPNRFEKQVNYLERYPDIFLIGGSAVVIDENGNKIGILKKFNNPNKIRKKLMKTNPIIHPSSMFRNTREFFYREKFNTSEDYDFYLRIISSEKKITNIPDFLVKYRISKNSFVSTMPNQIFYFKKAREFFKQRINSKDNQDDYSLLKEPKEKTLPKNIIKTSLEARIYMQLMDGKSRKVRNQIKKYIKEYGDEKIIFLYYLLSFLPKRIIWFLQKMF